VRAIGSPRVGLFGRVAPSAAVRGPAMKCSVGGREVSPEPHQMRLDGEQPAETMRENLLIPAAQCIDL